MSRLSALLFRSRYSFGIAGLCLVAAVIFYVMTSTGHLWLGFVVAAVIYLPGAIYLDHLRLAAENKPTEQELIHRVLR